MGARDIQELPRCAASSLMEAAPMAGKSRQPSHGLPLSEGRKTGTCQTEKTLEREGGSGEGKQPLRRVPMLKKTKHSRKMLT